MAMLLRPLCCELRSAAGEDLSQGDVEEMSALTLDERLHSTTQHKTEDTASACD
jgi:hypothetical protein